MKDLLNIIALNVIWYLLLSFLMWNIDISSWSWFARLVYLVLCIGTLMYDDEKKLKKR